MQNNFADIDTILDNVLGEDGIKTDNTVTIDARSIGIAVAVAGGIILVLTVLGFYIKKLLSKK